ncbi:MAG: hypothetical protein CMJ78_17210 [Planctomycetaceae bacterium]|nr:hypothetical protein [Planctomycetaceae bacterium]
MTMRICCLFVVAATMLPSFASAQDTDPLALLKSIEAHYKKLIKRASPSVVAIANIEPANLRRPEEAVPNVRRIPIGDLRDLDDPSSPDFIPKQFGSGITIAHGENQAERSILTNFHLVRGGVPVGATSSSEYHRIMVYFSDRRSAEARILAGDPRSDLAVLKLTDSVHVNLNKQPGLTLADASKVEKGESIVVLGNPYAIARDGSASVSRGMVSNISRLPAPPGAFNDPEAAAKTSIHHFGTLLHLDTRLNLGGSGGALLNLDGDLIGMTTSLAALEGYEKSVGFAVPFDQSIRRMILEELCKGFEVEYGFLGIYPANVLSRDLQRMRLNIGQFAAAAAVDVARFSPAAMGRLQRDDLILEINDRKILSRDDLMREIGIQKPGTVSKLQIFRRGRGREYLYVTLGKWPVLADEAIVATRQRPERQFAGLTIDFPTARRKFSPEPLVYPEAVLVLNIEEGSPADDAGIEVGEFITHVNGAKVKTPDDFAKAITDASNNKPVEFQFKDSRRVSLKP